MRKLLALLLVILVFIGLAMPVAAEDEELSFTISVASIDDFGNAKTIVLDIENNTNAKISFGWVNSCEVLVTTTEGTYSMTPHMLKASRGNSTHSLVVPNCPGEVKTIEITELILLNDDALPSDSELHDIVIYDVSDNITSYRGAFEDTSGVPWYVWVIISVFACFWIGIIVLIVTVVKKNKKKLEDAVGAVGSFASFNNTMSDEMFRQHQQDHQRFVDQVNQQQFNDFSHRSATTTDFGGFNPPPPTGL